METNESFWRKWWNSRSHQTCSDYELDRITSFRDKEIEKLTESEFLDFVNPVSRDFVFDAGCGTGVDINRIYSKVKAIIGMDIAEGMIGCCKRRLLTENINNTRLLIGSVSNIPLKNDTFDKILCMSVFHYLNNEECETTLKELVRISKDGAIIVLHIKNVFSLYLSTLYIAKRIKSLFKKNIVMENYRSFKWYEQKLSKLGANVIDFNSTNKFNFEFLPKFLFVWLQKIEASFNRRRILRKYGADYKMKVKIIKY